MDPADGMWPVEACSWDLTMGAAANTIGRLFLRSTSSSSSSTPEAIDHVGIICYSRLYEYGHEGILKSSIPRNGEDPVPQYPGSKLRKREFLGKTSRPKEEFVEWLVNVKYGEFRVGNYDMINHNCLDFAKAVCEFLGVPPSPNWEKVSNWAKANQKLTDMLTRGFRTGPRRQHIRENGRSVSLQEGGAATSECGGGPPGDPGPRHSSAQGTPHDDPPPPHSSPRRRRFSVTSIMSRTSRRNVRSASMETLPPTYEEALKMVSCRRESAVPQYEDLIKE